MRITRTHENLFDCIECYDDGTKPSGMPKVLQTLQNRLCAFKLSGCKLATFKSVLKFFWKKVPTKKSAKKQGYRQMFTEEEIRC